MVIKTGTAGADNLLGTAGADTLSGLGGNDRLAGLAGADLLDGGDGIDTVNYDGAAAGVGVDLLGNVGFAGDAAGDTLFFFENVTGSAFADTIRGNNLANVLRGGGGADQLDGSGGSDTADYATAKQGVVVSLLETTGFGGEALGDRYTSVENVTGSAFADELEGDGGVNVLKGGGGNDVLFSLGGADGIFGGDGNDLVTGGAGADELDGGGGIDTVDYRFSSAGVFVDLAFGFVDNGDAEGDTIARFENLLGSAQGDTLLGSSGANVLAGGAGGDHIRGDPGDDLVAGGAGADELDGGDGTDTLDYSASAEAIVANLNDGFVFGGDAQGDVIARFENLVGSAGSDFLGGNAGANVLSAGAAVDRLSGGLGRDVLTGGDGADRFSYLQTAESAATATGRDVIRDFAHAQGDVIELGGIDANTGKADDQAFAFIGQNGFTAAGQVRFFFEGDHTVVAMNTSGASGAESTIQLDGHVTLAAADFLL